MDLLCCVTTYSVLIWVIAPILVIIPCIVGYIIPYCKKHARQRARERVRGLMNQRSRVVEEPISTLFLCDCPKMAPKSALEREVLFAKYIAYLSRIRYISSQIAIGVLFYSFPYSILIRNIGTEHAYIYNIFFHVLQLISIQMFLKVSLCDPGVIRNTDMVGINANRDYRREYKHLFEPISIDPDNAPANFCWRCKFARPIRSKHDYDKDACVAVFDHYSTQIGNSIGAYNHRYFVLLKMLDTIVNIFCVYIIIDLIINNVMSEYSNIIGWIIVVVSLLCVLVMFLFAAQELAFHMYLASTNQTTFGIIKPQVDQRTQQWLEELTSGSHTDRRDSFDEGCLKNWILFVRGYEDKTKYFYGYQCKIQDSDLDSDSESD